LVGFVAKKKGKIFGFAVHTVQAADARFFFIIIIIFLVVVFWLFLFLIFFGI
jgi:hypothetical protein